MDYYDKYIKYKNKYLSLVKNKMTGGNLENVGKAINGPVAISYLENQELGKKIIILGDIHINKDGICDDTQDIDKYLKEITTEKPIDIFIEIYYEENFQYSLNKLNLEKPTQNTYMNVMQQFMINEYKKNINKRIHYTDIRKDIGADSLDFFSLLIDSIENGSVNLNLGEPNLVNDFIFNVLQKMTFSLMSISDYIKFLEGKIESISRMPPYKFFKEINKLYDKHQQKTIDLFEKTIRKIENYLMYFFVFFTREKLDERHELLRLRFKLNTDTMLELLRLGQYATAAVTDLYTVARILKNDEYNNNIIYVGYAHYIYIKDLLESIGFQLIKEIDNEKNRTENLRCIQNIIEFDEFFL